MLVANSLKTAYVMMMVPGVFGLVLQFLMGGADSGCDTDIPDASAGHDNFGFRLSLAAVCNFLLGAGVAGYVMDAYGPWVSLCSALAAGVFFVWMLAELFRVVHEYAGKGESETPEAQVGMTAKATTNLQPNATGSVDILIGNRNYSYFARTEMFVPVGDNCIITSVDGNTVDVKPLRFSGE